MSDRPTTTSARWTAAGFSAVVVTRAVGAAFAPALISRSPLALILLSPFLAHLVFAAGLLDPVSFFAGALTISIVQCLLGHRFGLIWGERAHAWIAARGLASDAAMARVLGWLATAAPWVLLAIPGPITCAMAGVARVDGARFYAPMLAAQLLWVAGCYLFGSALTAWIALAQAWVQEHVVVLTAIASGVVLARWAWVRWRRSREAPPM